MAGCSLGSGHTRSWHPASLVIDGTAGTGCPIAGVTGSAALSAGRCKRFPTNLGIARNLSQLARVHELRLIWLESRILAGLCLRAIRPILPDVALEGGLHLGAADPIAPDVHGSPAHKLPQAGAEGADQEHRSAHPFGAWALACSQSHASWSRSSWIGAGEAWRFAQTC
jgi:hypothetical protein